MSETIKKYDAFISYRHLPLDKAVAKRLQTLLEHIKPPRGLECKNTQRITRIFRDESELPTSGDLGSDLISALENSDFLIVLCSPKLKESKWCMAEIDHFKKRHGGRINRILPILVDGDPSKVFPDQIKFDTRIVIDENGNEHSEIVEVEPLACNIGSNGDQKKTLDKLSKWEFLRIAAPIFGCGYDDLFRRHRRRRIRRIITSAAASFLIVFIVSTLLLFQNRQVISQRDNLYVELSTSAYIAGHLTQAIQYALNALQPRNFFMPPPPITARKALTNAMGVYDLDDSHRPTHIVETDARILDLIISPNGAIGAALSAFEVLIFHTETGSIISRQNTIPSPMAEIKFLNNNLLLFAGENGITLYDITAGSVLWTGERASAIAAAGDLIASVYLRESQAIVYNLDGSINQIIDFAGRHQRVPYHDMFINPNANLLALCNNGKWLAVSFSDSNLTLFSLTMQGVYLEIPNTYMYAAFSGGFYGRYFVFSGARTGMFSLLMIIDMENIEIVEMSDSGHEFIVQANERGIYVSNVNIHNEPIVININPTDGTRRVMAVSDSYIINFYASPYGIIAATLESGIKIFDRALNQRAQYHWDSDFVALNGIYAIAASRDATEVNILAQRDMSHANIMNYDPNYRHEMTKVNEALTRVMRFSPGSFRLYDINGVLINETFLPEHFRIFNMQFSPTSGNLAVIYLDGLRIYSGETGELLFERMNLSSTFFADFGISIFEADGKLSLICIDLAEAVNIFTAYGDFAAYVGMVVDSTFLNGRELIGASADLFVVCDSRYAFIYDSTGRLRFYTESGQHSQAFFTDEAVIISPIHGIPAVYNLQNGRLIRRLYQEAILTDVHQIGDYIVIDYITILGYRFGILKNVRFEAVAYLPHFTGIADGMLLFDRGLGNVRMSRIYTLEELIQAANRQ